MIEIYFAIFFACGLAWGLALAPFQNQTTTNHFKVYMPETKETGVKGMVKEAKKNLDKMEKGQC